MINFDIKVLEWIRDNIDVVDDQETLHDFLSNKCNRFKVKNFVQFFAEYCNDPLLDGLDRGIVEESYGLYDGVENLKEIIYPGHLPEVGVKMFAWCRNLKTVELETGVISIAENAFERSGVEKLILPDTLSYINPSAFLQCDNLTKVKIPDSVESIFPEAFKACHNLVDVTLPKSVQSVGTGAFSYTGIKEIKIPGSLNLIPPKAFQGCKDLTTVDIEDGVIKIGDQAFFQTGVTVLEIPQSVKYYI